MRRSLVFCLVFFFSAALNAADKGNENIRSVENLDLNKFSGKWYEIARLPTPFEEGLARIAVTYTLQPNGQIEVLNEGVKDGKPASIKGRAWYPDPKKVSRMMVSFFLWFASDYIVFDMDPDGKSYMMITGRTKDSFWLFSRAPKMDDALYQKELKEAEETGFDLAKLIRVPQE
jgi:apolipoprotein D and lipocalin family protein